MVIFWLCVFFLCFRSPVGLMQTSTLAPPIKRARPDLLTALTVNNMQGMLKKPTLVPVAGGGLMLTAGSMPRMMTPLTTGRLPPVVTMMSPSRPLTSRPLVSRPSSTSNDYYNGKDIAMAESLLACNVDPVPVEPFNRRSRLYSGFHLLLAHFKHVKDKTWHQSTQSTRV